MRAIFDAGEWRPLILTSLKIGTKSVQVWMLVDTGADRTTISPDLAKALTGLEFDQIGDPGPEISGMGDSTPGRGTPSRVVDAELGYMGRRVPARVWVAPVPIPLLGRNDFMTRFSCRFYWDRNPPEFFVEPAQPPTKAPAPKATNATIRPKQKKRK